MRLSRNKKSRKTKEEGGKKLQPDRGPLRKPIYAKTLSHLEKLIEFPTKLILD